ncbi:hypothetical protein PTKIN_Ptkin07bG0284600 [Pterospermum kingtungense]
MEESTETSVKSHLQLILGNLSHQIMDLLVSLWECNKLIFSRCLSGSVTLVTGTIICPINGSKVKLCLQENTKTLSLLLIELPLCTAEITSSIDGSVLRIVLDPVPDSGTAQRWVTYCNGLKVGVARWLEVGEDDRWVLEMMHGVSAGAGILLHKGSDAGGYKYLRGQFEKIVGSDHSEAYHLADPSHCFEHELSVFFLSK